MHRAPAASIPPFGLGSLKFRSQGEETKKTCPGRGKRAVLTKGRTVAKFWEGALRSLQLQKDICLDRIGTEPYPLFLDYRYLSRAESLRRQREKKESASRGVRRILEFVFGADRQWLSVCCAPRTTKELAYARMRKRIDRNETERNATKQDETERQGSTRAPAFLRFCVFALIKCRGSVNGSPEIGQLSRAVAKGRSLKCLQCLCFPRAAWKCASIILNGQPPPKRSPCGMSPTTCINTIRPQDRA